MDVSHNVDAVDVQIIGHYMTLQSFHSVTEIILNWEVPGKSNAMFPYINFMCGVSFSVNKCFLIT